MRQPFTPAQIRALAEGLDGARHIDSKAIRKLAMEYGGPLLERLRASRAAPPAEIDNFNLEQQVKIRQNVLIALQKKSGIFIDYPRLGSAVKANGSRVKATGENAHGERSEGIGTVIWAGGRDPLIIFDDGVGRYPIHTVKPAFDATELEKMEAETIERASRQSFGEFKQWLVREVEKAIADGPPVNKVKAFFSALVSWPRFKNGTRVVVNGVRMDVYGKSLENAEGIVLGGITDDKYAVRFSQPNSLFDSQVHIVWANKMKKTAPLNAQELIDECVNETLTAVNEEKMREEIAEEFPGLLLESGLLLPGQGGTLTVNQLEMFRVLGERLTAAYADPELYSSPDMFSPPAERKAHVLRLELTQGCNHRSCTYCAGYKGVPYRARSYEEFVAHYKAVKKALGEEKQDIRRLFIGGANALSTDTKTLAKALEFLKSEFHPRRIALYGRADSINEKGKGGLEKLGAAGLNLIYWGIESGSQEVLDYVCKGANVGEMIVAGYRATNSDIRLSVTVMPGLGGMKYSQAHVDETASLLNEFWVQYITFMGVNPHPESKYALRMREEMEAGINRPLTDLEIVEQVRAMLKKIEPRGQRVGMFDCGVDRVGHNPISFNNYFDFDGQNEAIAVCDAYTNPQSK